MRHPRESRDHYVMPQQCRLIIYSPPPTRPTCPSASSRLHPLKTCFCILPLAVFGSSFGVPSSPRNQTHAGAFYTNRLRYVVIKMCRVLTCGFMLSHTILRTLSRDNVAPALDLIQVPTTSPYFLSGTLTTAASAMDGCEVSAFSICTGNKFSPPRMMIS